METEREIAIEWWKRKHYYFRATYHRKILDKLLKENKHFYKGVVLDIGGRNKSGFERPTTERWITTSLEKDENEKTDMILDACDMRTIASESIDTINIIEVFEHLKEPKKALKECYRILKNEGIMIMSSPFMFPVHYEPFDCQRWTQSKWQEELVNAGFEIRKFKIIGGYFSVLADTIKALVRAMPKPARFISYLAYPIMDLAVELDNLLVIQLHDWLGKYHSGYFIIAKKDGKTL